MGCLFRLGCLSVLAVAALVGWLTRDRWLPERYRSHPATVSAHGPAWQPLSDAGADRARNALGKLSQPRGPVYQTLSGADAASFAFRELAREMPPSTDSIQALVSGDEIAMRAVVKLSELGGADALGAMGLLGDHQRVQFTGTMRVVQPGLGEFQIRDVKVRGISIPRGMIATLIRRFGRGQRPSAVDADALPLPLPPYIGDIRVANGRITLYKNVK